MFINALNVYAQSCSVDCPLPSDGKLKVCSGRGIHFDRCSKSLSFSFCIIPPAKGTTALSYTYTIKRQGNASPILTDKLAVDAKSSVTGEDGRIEVRAPSFPVQQEGDYEVSVRVSDGVNSDGMFEFPKVPVRFSSRTVGLIIGISHYKDTDIHDLNYADDDATQVQNLLERLEPDPSRRSIKCLRNQEANCNSVKTELENLGKDSDFCKDDLFVFYYSGHGFISDRGLHFLGTYDIAHSNVEQTGIQTANLALRLSYVAGESSRRPRKLIIIDACYSGFYNKPTGLGTSPTGKGRIIVDKQISTDGSRGEDQHDLRTIHSLLEEASSELLATAAAEADAPAEECVVSPKRVNSPHCVLLDRLTDEERSKLKDLKGHGMYTYYLLGEIEKQMSSACYVDLTHDNQVEFKPEGSDTIYLLKAHENATATINILSESVRKTKARLLDLQHPTYLPGKEPNAFPPLPCGARQP